MNYKAILKGKEVVLTDDIIQWAYFMEKGDRIVAQTFINEKTLEVSERKGDEIHPADVCMISTVFLAINHNYSWDDQKPLWFETMIFGGPSDGEQTRYATWDEALAGHGVWVDFVRHEMLKD